MYRKYYLVEVVLLLLLSHGGWNGPSLTLLSCTSESSELVREVVQKRFLSVVERYRVPLPLECPLHPRRDVFTWLQTDLKATKVPGQNTWHCPVCGQKFGCENTFVTHWDASHSRTLGMEEEAVCLDDYCDVFRCDILRKRQLMRRMEEEEEIRKVGSSRLFQDMTLAQHRNGPQDDHGIEKKKCDPKAMSQIHYKCQSLIRQCTIGMLANLSTKDFQDIEDGLDQSICSFLTCEKYWDDFDPHTHRIPTLILAICSLLTVGLFSFCYYAIWILLEKHIGPHQICSKCQKISSPEIQQRHKVHKQRQKQDALDNHFKNYYSDYPLNRQNSSDFLLKSNSLDRNEEARIHKRALKNLEYDSEHNYQEHDSRSRALKYYQRQNSRRVHSHPNSPDCKVIRNHLEYNSNQNTAGVKIRQNSSQEKLRQGYDSRKNSPEYELRENSPEYDFKLASTVYDSRKNLQNCDSKQDLVKYESRKGCSEFVYKESSNLNHVHEPSEFYRKQNSNSQNHKQNSKFLTVQRPSSHCK